MSSTDRVVVTRYITETAGTDETMYAGIPFAGEWKLTDAQFLPDTTSAAHATNYTTLAVKQGSDTLGSLATSSVAFTAGTARAFTLTGGAALEFGGRCADVVTVTNTNAGTGVAVEGLLVLGFVRLNKG